jgi:phosphatidate cytidylyltransferase
VVALAALTGDLVESSFKRSAGIKDSSRLIPRLGGVLDVIDAIIFSAPLAYFLMAAYGN